MSLRPGSLLFVVALSLALASPVRAAKLIGLGNPPNGPTENFPQALSADGSTVAGTVLGSTLRAFRWTEAEGMQLIGPPNSGSIAISADGSVVVGWFSTLSGFQRTFRWTSAAGFAELDVPTDTDAIAAGVSDDGSVVVGSTALHVPGRDLVGYVFRWTAEDGSSLLDVLPGSSATALALSGDGLAIIGYVLGGPDNGAFRWSAESGLAKIELPGSCTQPFTISYDGTVVTGVGGRDATGCPRQTFRWTVAGGMEIIASPIELYPHDASGDGSVIVGSGGTGVDDAKIWDARHGIRSVRGLLADAGVDVQSWTLFRVKAVSDDGRTLVGEGRNAANPLGERESWLAVLPAPIPACANALDDDADGAVDFPADPGCFAANDDSEVVDCANAIDDDGDGLADLADPGCVDAADGSERNAAVECDDGIDNDGDALIDHPQDPGCATPASPAETGECQNGVDDDGDGLNDLDDPGCDRAVDGSEHTLDLACDDGLDNDRDGLVDVADPGCPFPVAGLEDPLCDDGLDNDGDGAVDFADPQCQRDWPYWESSNVCGLGAELALLMPLLARRHARRNQRTLTHGSAKQQANPTHR